MRNPKHLIVVSIVVGCLSQGARADLLTPAFENQLATWLGDGSLTFTNIYTKSGGDTSADFHAAVDGMGPTFALIEVLNPPGGGDPQIIGGYNPQSWETLADYHYTPNNGDRTAFIFNLSTAELRTQALGSPGDVGQFQTFNHANHGPTFGNGHDIYVNSSLSAGHARDQSYGALGNGGNNLFGVQETTLTYGAIEIYTFEAAVIPAPGSTILALVGLPLAGMTRRRRPA